MAHGDSEVFRLFHTDETDLPLPQGELEARRYRAESLRADLADIEKKISRETQLDRKYALAKEKQRIERELGRVVP